MAGFIFGGNTGETAQSLARKRAVAEQMLAQSSRAPQNVGEGLTAIGNALAGRVMERRVDREEGKRRKEAGSQYDAIVASLGGAVSPTGFNPNAPTPPAVNPAAMQNEIETQPLPPSTGFDPEAIYRAIEKVESSGDPNAVSPVGATGVMQIMPETARDPGFGVANIFDTARALGRPVPDESEATLQALLRDEDVNRTMGRAYFDAMKQRSGGNMDLALASYNAGPGAVDQYGGVPPFAETQNYVQKIGGMLGNPQQGQQPQQVQPQQGQQRGLDPRLLQLASNEYLSDPQRAVVNMLLQQQVERMQPPKPTDDMREYDMARNQGYKGSFFDFQRDIRAAGRSQTSIINEAADPMPQVGTIPQGFELRQTETGWQMAPIPGGPADMDAQKTESAAAAAAEQGARSTSLVLEDIGRLKDRVKKQKWYSPVTGVGSLLANIPGTSARDAAALATTITANIGFDRLQQMREASPTGGALGAVSVQELQALQSVLGNIELSQSAEQLMQNLQRLDSMYRTIMAKFAAYPNAAEFGAGDPPPSGPKRLRYNPETDELEPVE